MLNSAIVGKLSPGVITFLLPPGVLLDFHYQNHFRNYDFNRKLRCLKQQVIDVCRRWMFNHGGWWQRETFDWGDEVIKEIN